MFRVPDRGGGVNPRMEKEGRVMDEFLKPGELKGLDDRPVDRLIPADRVDRL